MLMKRGIKTLIVMSVGVMLVLGVGIGARPAAAVPTGTAERHALVMVVGWNAGNGSPPAPVDRTVLETASMIGVTDKNWYTAVSHGQFPGWHARGMGPYTITAPRMDAGGVCGAQFETDVTTSAEQAARAQGVDPAYYQAVVVYFSHVPQCPWFGLADDRHVWINGAESLNLHVTVMEMGHTLGLGHALALSCQDPAGHPVALSDRCDTVPYGDPLNASGGGTGSFSAIQQYDLGWMSGRLREVPAAGGTFTLLPLEVNDLGVQALRLVDGSATLWIEYRQPLGVDDGLNQTFAGVIVYRQLPGQGLTSYLLDMTPGPFYGFLDARMPVGVPWINPLGTMKITVVSAGPAGAQVVIESALPVVPNVRGATVTVATNTLVAAGFKRGTIHYFVDDDCVSIGRVDSQIPTAGTHAPTGTSVDLWAGTQPSHPCP
jgi:hypothetical protein